MKPFFLVFRLFNSGYLLVLQASLTLPKRGPASLGPPRKKSEAATYCHTILFLSGLGLLFIVATLLCARLELTSTAGKPLNSLESTRQQGAASTTALKNGLDGSLQSSSSRSLSPDNGTRLAQFANIESQLPPGACATEVYQSAQRLKASLPEGFTLKITKVSGQQLACMCVHVQACEEHVKSILVWCVSSSSTRYFFYYQNFNKFSGKTCAHSLTC